MAGSGRLVAETEKPFYLNEIDRRWGGHLLELAWKYNATVTFGDARDVPWSCEACIFSPPYYPRTDRRRPNAHDDAKRGPVVGFRDSYGSPEAGFIGDPGGSDAILHYRDSMREVYGSLLGKCGRMILVTKNWTRLGVELRLDLDTVLTAAEAGWELVGRHGWEPRPSLWSRYNASRNSGVGCEDVLIFRH